MAALVIRPARACGESALGRASNTSPHLDRHGPLTPRRPCRRPALDPARRRSASCFLERSRGTIIQRALACVLALALSSASSLAPIDRALAQDEAPVAEGTAQEGTAQAPTAREPTAREPTAQERQAAADAFDRGTRAFLARDYAHAAQWFETAYRMAPASVALVGAVRAHERAGNELRAATLALRLQAVHAGDRDADRQATQTLREHARRLVRVDVVCETACTVELDGTLMEHPSFFVAPSTEHVVRASFETGPVEQQVAAAEAGRTQELRFEAPPAPEPVATVEVPPTEVVAVAAPIRDEAPSEGGGMSPAFAITGIALTAIAGGVLVWSGVDTTDGVPAYEADPTPARLADGQDRELRTNVLIGVTAGLAAITVLLAIFTDWDGEPSSERADVQALVAPIDGGAVAVVGGQF